MANGELRAQQELFIERYLCHFNGTRAAIEAEYSPKSAHVQASRLLSDAKVSARIRERLESAAMEANEVLYHLAAIARGDLDDFVDDKGNLDIQKARKVGKTNLIRRVKNRAVITENSDTFETETEGYDRLKALELLGKHLGLFKDKLEISDWRSQAIEDIRAGRVTYKALAEQFDESLAEQLFASAGVNIRKDSI